ncbi:MAG: PEGA domain-containing protein [Patescibacteria group bacterium]|nr:PEGA domain-containing protein [Patescibacteria group bacterium]
MTRNARRRLFYALLALFFVFGTGVVLYAQGWRFDFSTGKFGEVGAIYIRSFPDYASITLNGKPIRSQVGFLSPGTLISGLFPKNYEVGLSAPGYKPWTEKATVAPMLVTEFKYAVLVPQNATGTASGTKAIVLALQSSTRALASTTIAARSLALSKGNLLAGSTTLANDVRSFSVSADGTMVAALEHKSVEIFSFTDSSAYERFNLPDIADIKQLVWYRDDEHLFVAYPNSISFLDLADVGLMNFATVASASSFEAYDRDLNILYVLQQKKLEQYQFPD